MGRFYERLINDARIKAFCVAMLVTSTLCAQGELIDGRDGHIYKTVSVGNQVWMAENLKLQKGDYFCPADQSENCEKYGALYTWDVAQDACPIGWHLPSQNEFQSIIDNVDGDRKVVFESLTKGGNSGFDAIFSGAAFHCNSKRPEFDAIGNRGFYWTSTNNGYFVFIPKAKRVITYEERKSAAFSVRCVRDILLTDSRLSRQ